MENPEAAEVAETTAPAEVAVADPVVTPDPAPETPTAPPERLTKDEARASAREHLRSKPAAEPDEAAPATDPVVDEQGRKHDAATGEYIEDTPKAEPDGETQPDDTAGASAPAEGQEPDAAVPETDGAPDVAPGISVEIDPRHPLAGSGLAAITVADKESAEGVKALLNGTYRRVAEVKTWQDRATSLEQELTSAQTELVGLKAQTAAQEQWRQSPSYATAVQQYEEIRDTVGQEAASRFWGSVKGELGALEAAETEKGMLEVNAQADERRGNEWVSESLLRMDTLPSHIRNLPDFDRWHNEEAIDFDDAIGKGRYPAFEKLDGKARLEAYHVEFAKRMGRRLTQEKSVIAAYKAKNDLAKQRAEPPEKAPDTPTSEEIATKAVADYKRSLADKRVANPTNPIGASAVIGEGDPSSVSRDPVVPDTDGLSTHQLKRQMRTQARDRTRALLAGR